MGERAPKIFYSWQSQLPASTTRNVIGSALKKVVQGLRADAEVEELPEIISGAGDSPGAPNIAEEILRHVDEATAIVFDVSSVGAAADNRPAPNANVLVELGYALKSAGHERTLPRAVTPRLNVRPS
jgi:hypothetical protein